MQSAIFNTPLIKIESLKTKFDSIFISNSFITLIGDYVEAIFLHQLHYWSYSKYGVVIDDVRWIYKPLREWLSEVFTYLSEWKLRVAIASLLEKGLIKREKLYVKHHEIKHNNPYWNPKNQTYYYSVNYDKLQELIEEAENAETVETVENVRIENFSKLSIEEIKDTKFCDCPQNRTNTTSIENSSKEKSHPTLPSESVHIKPHNQEPHPVSPHELVTPIQEVTDSGTSQKVIEKIISSPNVEVKINQDKCTSKQQEKNSSQQPNGFKPKTKQDRNSSGSSNKPVSKHGSTTSESQQERERKAPWKSEEEFQSFYQALIQALPIVANSHSPQGLAQTIIKQLRCGIPHSYWDDFKAGNPIGTSTMPEWEISPGVPYPMFIEYLTEKLKRGDNTTTNEQTRNEVFRILGQPRQAKAFWGQFKLSVVNVAQEIERYRSLGINHPYIPTWTVERVEPSLLEAKAAGRKITAVNDDVKALFNSEKSSLPQTESRVSDEPNSELSSSNSDPWIDESQLSDDNSDSQSLSLSQLLKNSVKSIPQVSPIELESTALRSRKTTTDINQMTISEINECLQDPILRNHLTGQLIRSDRFELIMNELGSIIKVEPKRE